MVPIDPESSPAGRNSPGPERENAGSQPTDGKPLLVGTRRVLVFAATAGLIAGVASWLAGEMVHTRYQRDLLAPLAISPSPEQMRRWKDARLYSAALTFTLMGGCLGLAMGAAGGAARRSGWAGVKAAIFGLVMGTAAAAAAALFLVPFFFKTHDPQSGSLVLPLLTHGAILSAVGAIGGLAFGLGMGGQGRWKSALAGGLVGGAAATIVYEIVGAVAFATYQTDMPVSSSIITRGIAQMLVAVLSAVGASLALQQSAKPVLQ
jgi:hypothetical protein